MSGLEALVTVLVAFAWPMTVAGLAVIFRHDARALLGAGTRLLDRTTELKVGMLYAVAKRPLPPRPRG